MNFQEYLAIRNMENPLDFVTRIIVKAVYPECYSISSTLNNGVVFVKEKYNSEGVYFDVYGNMGSDIFEDSVTKNRVAIDIKEEAVPVKKHYERGLIYVGNDDIEKLKDYLLVCPMLFTTFSDDLIKQHGEELMSASISSLRKHFKLFCWNGLDRGFSDRFVRNIHGAALASNFTGGVSKIYKKYLSVKGISEEEAKDIINDRKAVMYRDDNYQAKMENLFAFSADGIKEIEKY